jgi:hypothetical protein
MKGSVCRSLAAVMMVCGLGLIATSTMAASSTSAEAVEVRASGKGIPSLGSGCSTGCSGQKKGQYCQICEFPGADVTQFNEGSGWESFTYPCTVGRDGACSGGTPNVCMTAGPEVECLKPIIDHWREQPKG